MIGIVLASHGKLSVELLKSAEMIMGEQECVMALALQPDEDPMSLKDSIIDAIDKVKMDDGAIVLVDLMGGSPGNAAAYAAKEGVPVITGMNLPILLELLSMRYSEADSVVKTIMNAGKEGIMDIREILGGTK